MSPPAIAGIAVVRAESDDELSAVIVVRRTVEPDAQPSLVNMRHTLATFPHAVYLLARAGDEPVGCAYTVSSSYPLAVPIHNPGVVHPTLQAYARARHDAALRMLAVLDVNPPLRHRP